MPWAIAQTEPIREKTAQTWLDRAGFGTYLPMVAGQSRNVPLFPGYLPFEYGASWYSARWQPGVLGIIMAGERPAHVPDGVIADLHKRERNGVVVLPLKSEFKIGQQVRVTSGAFVGHLAIFQCMTSAQRVCVLLQLLGQLVPVELPPGHVEATASCGKNKI